MTQAETKGERTRAAILEAAIERFGRDGFRSTSVADIARDAGVGGTVAYAYFPNKEALFLAAADEDAAAVIEEARVMVAVDQRADWRESLITTLIAAVGRHPLARRLLGGLEPEVTERVLETSALAELRKDIAERLRSEQAAGTVRSDIDPVVIANGTVAISLSLLMSVLQLGAAVVGVYAGDIRAVIDAAIDPVRVTSETEGAPRGTRRDRSQ